MRSSDRWWKRKPRVVQRLLWMGTMMYGNYVSRLAWSHRPRLDGHRRWCVFRITGRRSTTTDDVISAICTVSFGADEWVDAERSGHTDRFTRWGASLTWRQRGGDTIGTPVNDRRWVVVSCRRLPTCDVWLATHIAAFLITQCLLWSNTAQRMELAKYRCAYLWNIGKITCRLYIDTLYDYRHSVRLLKRGVKRVRKLN